MIALILGYVVVERASRTKLARLAVESAIAYIGAVVLAAPYLYYALKNYPKSFHKPDPNFWTDLAGVVVPRVNRLLGMNWLAQTFRTSAVAV